MLDDAITPADLTLPRDPRIVLKLEVDDVEGIRDADLNYLGEQLVVRWTEGDDEYHADPSFMGVEIHEVRISVEPAVPIEVSVACAGRNVGPSVKLDGAGIIRLPAPARAGLGYTERASYCFEVFVVKADGSIPSERGVSVEACGVVQHLDGEERGEPEVVQWEDLPDWPREPTICSDQPFELLR